MNYSGKVSYYGLYGSRGNQEFSETLCKISNPWRFVYFLEQENIFHKFSKVDTETLTQILSMTKNNLNLVILYIFQIQAKWFINYKSPSNSLGL
jgi:hypothetical protein